MDDASSERNNDDLSYANIRRIMIEMRLSFNAIFSLFLSCVYHWQANTDSVEITLTTTSTTTGTTTTRTCQKTTCYDTTTTTDTTDLPITSPFTIPVSLLMRSVCQHD